MIRGRGVRSRGIRIRSIRSWGRCVRSRGRLVGSGGRPVVSRVSGLVELLDFGLGLTLVFHISDVAVL